VINKIDMDGAKIPEVTDQIVDLIGCKPEDILLASGKSGIGIEEILQGIIERIPAPEGDYEAPLQALIFDSVFNSFRGIIVYYRILNGVLKKGDKIRFVASGADYFADEVGVLKLEHDAERRSESRRCGLYHYRYQKCKRSKSRRYHYPRQ
jgi:GTP-binding protein LepA